MQYCGLSLGWPLVQCQLVVSSTWALLYYKEVSTMAAITLTVHIIKTEAALSCALLIILGH